MSHRNIPAGLDQLESAHQLEAAEFGRTHNNRQRIDFGLRQKFFHDSLEILTLRFTCEGRPPAGLADTSRIIPYNLIVLVLQHSSEYPQSPLSVPTSVSAGAHKSAWH